MQFILNLFQSKRIKELEAKIQALTEEKDDIRQKSRNLVWNLGNQQEKIKGNLESLVKTIYPQYTVEHREEIKNAFLKNTVYYQTVYGNRE